MFFRLNIIFHLLLLAVLVIFLISIFPFYSFEKLGSLLFVFIYFLVLSCLFFLAILTSFSSFSMDFELNQSLVLKLLTMFFNVFFVLIFDWTEQNPFQRQCLLEGSFSDHHGLTVTDYNTSHLATGLLVELLSLTRMCI